ncbi:MAG: dephospho-CoA kinase, partial [Ancrocorticia sp.]|nr:dephospho-CoA kinase [Ancrocorticia sp.]
MLLISLTGGIGVGKSTAASLLKQRGAQVLVLDEVARTILDPGTSATWEVSQIWPSVVRDGLVDRAALAKIVFGDPKALAQLNAITHPRTWQAAERILEEWDASGDAEVAVIEIAILANSPRKFSSHLNVV